MSDVRKSFLSILCSGDEMQASFDNSRKGSLEASSLTLFESWIMEEEIDSNKDGKKVRKRENTKWPRMLGYKMGLLTCWKDMRKEKEFFPFGKDSYHMFIKGWDFFWFYAFLIINCDRHGVMLTNKTFFFFEKTKKKPPHYLVYIFKILF